MNNLFDVTLSKCIDGDTAYLYINGESTRVRFLAIDTPEYTTKKEQFGKEASDFTCNKLSQAKSIQIEYDGETLDKYGRTLAWVYTDGTLLQKELVESGLAEVAYIYGDYKYTDELCRAEETAYDEGLNIWSYYSWNKTYCSTHEYKDNYKVDNTPDYGHIFLLIVVALALIIGFIKFVKDGLNEIKKK